MHTTYLINSMHHLQIYIDHGHIVEFLQRSYWQIRWRLPSTIVHKACAHGRRHCAHSREEKSCFCRTFDFGSEHFDNREADTIITIASLVSSLQLSTLMSGYQCICILQMSVFYGS
ncbi:hypothetical protein DPEC_G00114110 [Dallia pectoralis]|uniref:Uncharacterized protein n=1 Tax=Dallia pectoralis TaxID=75939 RepID=A0ACC2GUL0_DALPE|nr:hypothetical protein DPEC_G00114110 [Dallia pectoralis]